MSAGEMPAAADARAGVAAPAGEGGGWRAVTEFWMLVYRRNWRGSVVTGTLTPLAFLAGMGWGLGALIDSGERSAVPGVPYLVFVATGLLAAQAMQTGVMETTIPVMRALRWRHTYEAMYATPLRLTDLVRGHVVYVVIRVAINSTLFILVALVLGALQGPGIPLAWACTLLIGVAFGMPVYAYTALIRSENSFTLLNRFVVMPLFLFSGTFFPLSQLPSALQALAWISPLSHGTALVRALTLGTESTVWPGAAALSAHAAYLGLWAVGGAFLAVWALRRRIVP